jgi:hypothetical protein
MIGASRYLLDDYTALLWQPAYGVRNEYRYGVVDAATLPAVNAVSYSDYPQSATFDKSTGGSESRVELANSTGFRFGAGGTGNFSFVVDAYVPESMATNQVLWSKATDNSHRLALYFSVGDSTKLALTIDGGYVYSTAAYPSTGWHRFAVTRVNGASKAALRIWQDGVQIGYDDTTYANSYEFAATTGPLYLGYYGPNAAISWSGALGMATCRNIASTADFALCNDRNRIARG